MKNLQTVPIAELIEYEEKIRQAMLGADKHTRLRLQRIRTQVLDAVRTRVQ